MLHSVALITVFISRSTSSQIECSGTNQCLNDTVACPPDEDCVVQCFGESSCSFTIVQCPSSADTSCSIYCHDDLSCNDMTVLAEDAATFNIHSHGVQSLAGSSIYCPSNIESACNITSDGDGLDDVNIYSEHDELSTIHVQCSSSSECWSVDSNPVIHYGTDYSTTCTVSDIVSSTTESVQCVRPQMLIITAISTALPAPIATEFDDFESILTNDEVDVDSDVSIEEDEVTHSGVDAIFFVLIGLCGGFLISILCGVPCCYHWTNRGIGGSSGAGFEIKVNDKTPVIRPQRLKLSPSLQKLSPALAPSHVELNTFGGGDGRDPSPIHLGSDWKPAHSVSPSSQTNLVLANLSSMGSLPSRLSVASTQSGQLMSPYTIPSPQEVPDFMISDSNPIDDGIVVTVGRYANEHNECDESPGYVNEFGFSHDVYAANFADIYKVTIGGQLDCDDDRTPTPGRGHGEFEVMDDSDSAVQDHVDGHGTNEGA